MFLTPDLTDLIWETDDEQLSPLSTMTSQKADEYQDEYSDDYEGDSEQREPSNTERFPLLDASPSRLDNEQTNVS